MAAGCATPEYAIRQTPVPDESEGAVYIERAISAEQAKEFEQQGSRRIGPTERLATFDIQRLVDSLSRVTERPGLRYRAYLVQDRDPNAAALADGRIYLTTGLLTYFASRGSRVDELAFILSHELAHTVAQHLVKRYRMVQQQQLVMALVAAGAAAATRNAGEGLQQAGRLALDATSFLQDVHDSGFSQEQELEADQLGIRYVMRVGLRPAAALELLDDFQRFDSPSPFLRTHPYMAIRREYLQRYLTDIGALRAPGSPTPTMGPPHPFSVPSAGGPERRRIKALRDAQTLYPAGSISWKNLQRQIDELN